MSHEETRGLSPAPWQEAEKALILDELNRLLASPKFISSQRCVKLLHHLVLKALENYSESLKERTLGHEVFGREADYDTSSDPVVRITASEIRKRLASHYKELNPEPAIRICLATGGYLPTFEFHSGPAKPESEAKTAGTGAEAPPPAQAGRTEDGYRWLWALGLIGVLLMAAGVYSVSRMDRFRSTDYLLWKPLLQNTKQDIVLCVSDYNHTGAPVRASQPSAPSGAQGQAMLPMVLMEDARTAHKLSKRLLFYGRSTSFYSASELSLKSIRDSSLVLIGGLNNPWFTRLVTGMRYNLLIDSTTEARWIQDTQAPGKREWSVPASASQTNQAYGLITRFVSKDTGGPVLALTGTGPLGVEAAAELISAPWLYKDLPASLRTEKNFQVVLKATIVEGSVGPPQILSVYTW